MNTIKLLITIGLSVWLLTGCTLSGEKENRLNNQFNRYLDAYNKRNTLVFTALTNDQVVKYYTQQPQEVFEAHFNPNFDSIPTFLSNPLNRDTKTEGKIIQRKYSVERYTETQEINHDYFIFALSEDEGNTWFFVNEDDYFNDKIPLKRLFTK